MSQKISEQKMQEFKNKMMNYNNWRWHEVSLYQGMFIVFVTSAILLLIEIISNGDLLSKIFFLILLIFLSYGFYKKILIQTQKPIFVAENMVGTMEGQPVEIKGEDGKNYLAFKLSGIQHKK